MYKSNESESVPIPVPTPIPDIPVSIDITALIHEISDCYQNVTIEKEKQLTLRTRAREQARVAIAAIDANTKEFELSLEQHKSERGELIKLLCDIIRHDGVDESSLRFCEKVLEYLYSTNPMDRIGNSMQYATSFSKAIGGSDNH
jgi:hypothetical protein